MKDIHVHISIPCYGGIIYEPTTVGLMNFANESPAHGIKWSLSTLGNESLITRGRNLLTAAFLAWDPKPTHLLWIDADVGFTTADILALLKRDKDVISGLVPKKTLPLEWAINLKDNNLVPDKTGLLEVSRAGNAFLLIKRKVFEKMLKHPKVVPFESHCAVAPSVKPHIRTFFETDVRNGEFLSEDWFFSENWKDLGGKIYVDTNVLLSHSGMYKFSPEMEIEIYEKYKKRFKQYG